MPTKEDEHRPGPVLLVAPGYVQVDEQSIPSLLTNPDGVFWDDSAQDRQRERLWSVERPKRFLAAPIAVGTIDQAPLSVLQIKRSLLRSVCLDRSPPRTRGSAPYRPPQSSVAGLGKYQSALHEAGRALERVNAVERAGDAATLREPDRRGPGRSSP